MGDQQEESALTTSTLYEHRIEVVDESLELMGTVPLGHIGALAQRALDAGAPDTASWFTAGRRLIVMWKTTLPDLNGGSS